MVEGARLECVYAVIPYRGFESHPLRHKRQGARSGPLFVCRERGSVNEPMFDDEVQAGFRPRGPKAQGAARAASKSHPLRQT